MKMKLCQYGHPYDSEKYAICPFCLKKRGESKKVMSKPERDLEKTVLLQEESLTEVVTEQNSEDNRRPEPSNEFLMEGDQYPLGWIVCVEGNEYGRAFSLKNGMNLFSVEAGTVRHYLNGVLDGKDQFMVMYNYLSGEFSVIYNGTEIILLVNSDPLYGKRVLESGDVICFLGRKFLFQPLCSKTFYWNL